MASFSLSHTHTHGPVYPLTAHLEVGIERLRCCDVSLLLIFRNPPKAKLVWQTSQYVNRLNRLKTHTEGADACNHGCLSPPLCTTAEAKKKNKTMACAHPSVFHPSLPSRLLAAGVLLVQLGCYSQTFLWTQVVQLSKKKSVKCSQPRSLLC